MNAVLSCRKAPLAVGAEISRGSGRERPQSRDTKHEAVAPRSRLVVLPSLAPVRRPRSRTSVLENKTGQDRISVLCYSGSSKSQFTRPKPGRKESRENCWKVKSSVGKYSR